MSNLNWTDTTSYARDERGTVPARTWATREVKGIRRPIVVTRLHGIPDVWHVTCHGLDIDGFPLQAKDIEAAKIEAVSLVQKRLRAAADDLA
jgi:hypothetical protein